MKILLIAVPLMDRFDGKLIPIAMDRFRSSPPLGVYWLASTLRDIGHEINILDLIALGRIDINYIQKCASEAELVGVSCNSLNWPTARVVTSYIKSAHPALPVVLGGIHPGMYPEHVLNSCPADFIIRGEGEVPLRKLVEALEGKCSFKSVPVVLGLGKREASSSNRILACFLLIL